MDRSAKVVTLGWLMLLLGLVLFWCGVGLAVKSAVASPTVRSSYATCYDEQGFTASGTYVNRRTAANNRLPAGTKIQLVGPQAGPGGIRRYVVRDTGGAPMQDGHFDLWAPSGCIQYGHRAIHYRIGWSK